MIRIFDCSNSVLRPANRGYKGPVENTIVRDLKKYAHLYDSVFVDKIQDADVALTNDVFTKEVLTRDIPRVKRMDGVFFQSALRERNSTLNRAAQQADLVIFISQFSKDAYFNMYGKQEPLTKDVRTILNWVDDSIFTPKKESGAHPLTKFVAVATSWAREEKRFNDILRLAIAHPDKEFVVIGEGCPTVIPDSITPIGYLEDEHELASVLQRCDAMVCTAFRDAAPKTVAQGAACGLPVFYANSGGVPELVDVGYGYSDYNEHRFYEVVPPSSRAMEDGFAEFLTRLHTPITSSRKYQTVISSYFSAINSVLT